jgi:Flp pilus assembly protein TadD
MFRGRFRIERANCSGALEDFIAAQRMAPDDPIVYASAGLAAICLGDRRVAAQNFRRSLELQPNQPRIRAFLRQLR